MHMARYKAAQLGQMGLHWSRGREPGRYGNERIDPERTRLNYDLAADGTGRTVAERAADCIARPAVRALRRADVNLVCDWVVTLPGDWPDGRDPREFFEAADAALRARYERPGTGNVLGAWVHMDETTPHMHWAHVPLAADENPRHAEAWKVSADAVYTRAELRRAHPEVQAAVREATGCACSLLLDEGDAQRRALSHVPHEQLDAARAEMDERAEQARREAAEASRAAEEAAVRMEAARRAERAARAAQEAAEAAMRQAEERAEQARARLEGLRRDGDAAEERVAKLEGERSAVYERLAGLPGKAERDAAELRELEAEFVSLRDREREAQARNRALRETLEGLCGRVATLGQDVRGLGERLSRARSELQALARACWRAGATLYARLSRWGREALSEAGYRVRDPLERTIDNGMHR